MLSVCSFFSLAILASGTVDYLSLARKTSRFLDENLRGVLPNGTFGGFVNSTSQRSWSFCWANFALLSADSAMILLLEKNNALNPEIAHHLARMQNVVAWNRKYLWDTTLNNGGFYSAALSDNPAVREHTMKYVDDLSYAGIAMLQCFHSLRTTRQQNHSLARRCLQFAAECGDWLLQTNDTSIWAPGGG